MNPGSEISAATRRLAFTGLGIVALAALVGCVASVGYDGDVGVGYYPGYYEPWGYDYGGWGGGYLVGPARGGYRGGGRAGGGGGRAAPSIPTRVRGGRGGAGGGGHGGGDGRH